MTASLHADRNRVALLIVDMQNDFLHAVGAYGRAGQTSPQIAALTDRLSPVVQAMRSAGCWIVSTQFTLVPAKGGEPLISPHLRKLRPFLTKGDFCPGQFGHQLVDKLAPADLTVEKVAYSAFYMTRLEWLLRKCGIEQLVICGIVTNGGVASTLRDAHVRDFETLLLSDGTGAFDRQVHEDTLKALATISSVATCEEVSAMLS